MRWVHQYEYELNERIRKHLKRTNDSWRMDETYIKIKGENMYLYRAVDSEGNTLDFYLSKKTRCEGCQVLLKKALASFHVTKPRVITVDGNKAYPLRYEN
jgi:IS6 family transposase